MFKISLLWAEIDVGEINGPAPGRKASDHQSQGMNASLSDYTKPRSQPSHSAAS